MRCDVGARSVSTVVVTLVMLAGCVQETDTQRDSTARPAKSLDEWRAELIRARAEEGIAAKSGASGLVQLDGVVYFGAPTRDGWALWRSDGTREGTRPAASTGQISNLKNSGGALSFTSVGGSLGPGRLDLGPDVLAFWMSDGTADGTRRLLYGSVERYHSTVPQGICQPDPAHVHFYAVSAGDLHFISKSQTGMGGGPTTQGLYAWRGDSNAPTLLKRVSGRSSFVMTGSHRGHLLFTMGAQLWASDGTPAGTRMLHKSIVDVGWGIHDDEKLAIGDTLFLRRRTAELGHELWRQPVGGGDPVLVRDIAPGRADSAPRCFASLEGELVFLARGNQLWRSDGTTTGTTMITPSATSPPREWGVPMVVDGVRVVYDYSKEHGREPHRWNDAGDRTVLIKDINPGRAGSSVSTMARVGDVVVFGANDGVHGEELWCTDGTSEGTRLLKDITPGAKGSSVTYLTAAEGVACFFAATGEGGYSLWRTDGTPDGTRQILDIAAGTDGASMSTVLLVDGVFYFIVGTHREVAADAQSPHPHGAMVYVNEVWRTDGSDAGTEVLQRWIRTEPKAPPAPPVPPGGLRERMLRERIHNVPQVPSAPRP